MAIPPVFDGAVHVTSAEPFPRWAVTAVGESGSLAGVTADDGGEAGPVPMRFVAVTVNV
jgi:hypothetical protein